MEDINSEISSLEEKLKELKRQKEELSKQITINLHHFSPANQQIAATLSKFRPDVVDWMRVELYRQYVNGDNLFNVQYLPKFLVYIENDPTIQLTWNKKDLEDYTNWLNLPDLSITLAPNKPYVNLEIGPKVRLPNIYYLTLELPSFTTISHKGYRFSTAEFYLFPAVLQKFFPGVTPTYSDEAFVLLSSQLEKRKELSVLATAMDYDMPNPFQNGYDLKGHQRVAIRFAELAGGKSLIAYDMGTGKSAIGIGYAERHPEFKRILVICPASLKTNWKREIKKFTNNDSHTFSGIEPDNLAIDALSDGKYKYFIINYDIIGRAVGEGDDRLMKWVELLNVFNFDLVILDEAHYIKNMGSNRSKGVSSLKFQNILPMSGTPIVNRPMELYPNLALIAPQTFSSPSTFAHQFTNPDGTARNVKKLHEMLSTYMIRRTRKDIYGDSIYIERIPFTKELSPTARVNYQKILEGIYISLRRPDYQRDVPSILAQLTRCKQTCSSDNVESSADLARDAFEETDKKVLIFSQFKESQAAISMLLGEESCVVNGDVKDEQRYDLVDKFQDPNSNLKYFITNIVEGLTLTQGHTVIFNDIWWTPKDHAQMEGRCFGRDNDPHGGNSYWLENENTIDQFLNALIMKKTSIFNEVVDGIKSTQEEQGGIVSQLLLHIRESF